VARNLNYTATKVHDDDATAVATVQNANANVAASQTDSVLVAATPGKKVRVLWVVFQAGNVATALTFNSKGAGAGTAISPTFANGANGGFVLPLNNYGWFQTNAGEGLTVTTGAGSATGIRAGYVLV
jgi:hypothetical protein